MHTRATDSKATHRSRVYPCDFGVRVVAVYHLSLFSLEHVTCLHYF